MSHQPCTPAWSIQIVKPIGYIEVLHFINAAHRSLFPDLSSQSDDETIFSEGCCFLEARNGERLIATMGYVPYDHRFPQLKYRWWNTVEVIRLYVLPEYRRQGLATTRFENLCGRAMKDGVKCLYLHTHPMLPGALRFWWKRGFDLVLVEDDPVWKTTHMQMMLEHPSRAHRSRIRHISC
jgi:GNAT superfamily N-acetyltransferase